MSKKAQAPKKTKEKKQSPEKGAFEVSLNFTDISFSATGETVLEAMSRLRVPFVKGKAVLRVVSGEKKAEHLMFIPQIRRFLVNPITKAVLEKRMLSILK